MSKVLSRHNRLFVSRWLRNPLRTGAVLPSSPALGKLMASHVDPDKPGKVIELGGGTGAITLALIERGIEAKRLVVVELDDRLQLSLKQRFPDVEVLHTDAAHLKQEMDAHSLGLASTVVSSLPLINMPAYQQGVVLDQAFASMAEDGVFVQYTYGPTCPVRRGLLRNRGLKAMQAGKAWLNVPPARVWLITRDND